MGSKWFVTRATLNIPLLKFRKSLSWHLRFVLRDVLWRTLILPSSLTLSVPFFHLTRGLRTGISAETWEPALPETLQLLLSHLNWTMSETGLTLQCLPSSFFAMSVYNALSCRTMGKLPLFISPEGVQCSGMEDTAWLISIKFIRILKAVSPAQPRTHVQLGKWGGCGASWRFMRGCVWTVSSSGRARHPGC